MTALSRVTVAACLLFAAEAIGCATPLSAQSTASLSSLDSVVLERTTCLGPCPEYRLLITRSGLVSFHARLYAIDGHDSVAPSSVVALLPRATQLGFFKLPPVIAKASGFCADLATDLPTTTVALFGPQGFHQVEDYLGCSYRSAGQALSDLRRFENAIDSLAGSSRWYSRSGPRQAAPQFHLALDEAEYLARVYRYEQLIKGDLSNGRQAAALRELEPRLRAIVGPFDVPAFDGKGRMNNDDLYEEEGGDKLDGFIYFLRGADTLRGEGTMAVVTTEPLFRAWLKHHWEISDTLPMAAAVKHQGALTSIFVGDAAAVPYVQLPADTLRALGLPFGWIGSFEQDDCNCAAPWAVFAVPRARQFVIVALVLDQPIPPPAACKGKYGDDYRACYEPAVLRDPRLGQVVAQIRKTVGNIKQSSTSPP